MKRFVVYSLLLHTAIIVILVVGFKLDLQRNKLTEVPISMVFDKVAEKRAAPKPKVKQKPPAPKPEPVPDEPVEIDVPEPAPLPEAKPEPVPEPIATTDPPPVQPETTPKPKPPEPKKPKAPKPVTIKRKPATRPKAIKKLVEKKQPQPDRQAFEDLLQEIDMQDAEPSPPADREADQITASEIDAVRQKIYRCWIVPAGARGAKDLSVDIDMQLHRDGTVYKADIVDTGRYRNDPFFRAAAESAQRAVLDPACNPLPLNPSKYDTWKSITMTFNPEDMFRD